jgi:outer membrane protein assembly factor BamD (BamD/ComL family)
MSAFSAGDYGRAEQLFVSFEQQHAADARVEDTLFLRALARSRRGDADGSRAIARDYLRRYPNGLRRQEAQRLAQ